MAILGHDLAAAPLFSGPIGFRLAGTHSMGLGWLVSSFLQSARISGAGPKSLGPKAPLLGVQSGCGPPSTEGQRRSPAASNALMRP